MKNYSKIYDSLREEIMRQIDSLVGNLLAKYDVECISYLEDAPVFQVYVTEYIDDGLGHSEPTLIRVTIEDIFVGGECAGYTEFYSELQPYALYEITTDGLIDIYERLCKYSS
jgi:hypothetical protein